MRVFVPSQREVYPAADKRRGHGRTPEKAQITPHRRREQTNENKENVAVVTNKDAEMFAQPAPRTPATNKKIGRPNKNILNTPTSNNNNIGAKTTVDTPKGMSTLTCLVVYGCFLLSTLHLFHYRLVHCPLQPTHTLIFQHFYNQKWHIHTPHICK